MSDIGPMTSAGAPKQGASLAVAKSRFARFVHSPTAGYAALGIVAAIIIIAAVSSLASFLVAGWSRRDVELRARLVFRSIHDQVAAGIAENPESSLVPFFDRIAEDERILALGFCPEKGDVRFATKEMPASLRCDRLPLGKADSFSTLSEEGRRIRVSIFPMTAGRLSGHLLVLHDLSFIDKREREVRLYTTLALLGVATGFGLLTIAIILALTRSWTRSIRGVIADARRGDRRQGLEPGEFPISKEISALLTEFRVERKFTHGIHVEWSPQDLASTARRRTAGRPGSHRLQSRALHSQSRRGQSRRCKFPPAAWSPRSSRSCGRAAAPGSRTAAAAPTAKPSTIATASACRPHAPQLHAAARMAHRGGAGRLLLRLRQRRAMAALPHRLRAAGVSRERLAPIQGREQALRRCGGPGGHLPRSDRAGAGLSFRASAAHDPPAAAKSDDHHFLAHSLAERGNLRHLPVARGDHRRPARQLDPGLSHAVPLQQFPRGGRPLHRKPDRSGEQFGHVRRPRDIDPSLSHLDRMAARGARRLKRRSRTAAPP